MAVVRRWLGTPVSDGTLMLKCSCGNVLAVRRGDLWDVRHRGRRVLVPLIVAIECEDCGATLWPDAREPAGVA